MDLPLRFGGRSPAPAPQVSPAVFELRLVLLGGSTAGKRAAANAILGTEECGRRHSTNTVTQTSSESQHSQSRQVEVAGRRLTMVQTPDWFCGGLSETDTSEDVGFCVRLSAPGPHAFLLVVPVEPSEGKERVMLEKMEDIFGGDCWRYTLILFTHAGGLGERTVEELLQNKGSLDLQQLVEKCGNRYHLLKIRDRPVETEISQLREKIGEMVSGNRQTFYSIETYQEAEKQAKKIKRRIQIEREKEEIELRRQQQRRGSESQRTGLEDRHREEMEDMRESYRREARVEAEAKLMKIILPQLQTNIVDVQKKLEAQFQKEMAAKNRQLDTLLELIERHMLASRRGDPETEMEAGTGEEKDRTERVVEIEAMMTHGQEWRQADNVRLRQEMVKMRKDMEKLRQDVTNLTQTQALLASGCVRDSEGVNE
ncbi:GTPase IMAP family member 4-like [Engraulis encrasicolus]|uniref:GTPase IMAP family member 4-like n=1 Tax=Engraulis encrasicolus TaxID=184585 RepID=UPI002FD4490A